MQMQVYDTATRRKQPLLVPGAEELRMYVCGPTVYDRIHVGNARTFATFLMFVRYLRFCGVRVRYVSNITDVNDKIYDAARERGMASDDLARAASQWYVEDMDRLGLGRPDEQPRVSTSMGSIIQMIEELVARDAAYEAGGDVYFRVSRHREYGKLSNRTVDDMVAGSRDELDPGEHKQHPLDFTLWKAAKPDEDTAWDSPWGRGRPGWHIECSAMACDTVGASFDVHGGGLDLLFPHNENEQAQSRAAGHGFARLWMHAGMLEAGDGAKMSKSVGNIDPLHEVLDRIPSWQLLLLFMSGSWRGPLSWSEQGLHDAHAVGIRITETLRRSERYLATVQTRGAGDDTFADGSREWEGIHEALRDDFNTAEALKELNGLLYDLNTAVDEHATPQLVRNQRHAIVQFLEVFGLLALQPEDVDVTTEAQSLIEARDAARKAKDFDESDRLRAELEAMGYVVRDTAVGTEVHGGQHGSADGDDATADAVEPDQVDPVDEVDDEDSLVPALQGDDA